MSGGQVRVYMEFSGDYSDEITSVFTYLLLNTLSGDPRFESPKMDGSLSHGELTLSFREADRDGWRCPRCGSSRWVAASLTGPVAAGGRAIKQCVPCGHYSNEDARDGR